MNIFIFKDKTNTSAGYKQVTEEELSKYKASSESHVYLINLGHSVMEVDEAYYYEFYKQENREKYRKRLERKNKLYSIEDFTGDDFRECDLLMDKEEPFEDKVLHKLMAEKLPEALQALTDEERDLIDKIYFQHISERALASILGIPRKTLSYRKEKALWKLKNFFEKS